MEILELIEIIIIWYLLITLIIYIGLEIYIVCTGSTSSHKAIWIDNTEQEEFKNQLKRYIFNILLSPIKLLLIISYMIGFRP